jgi:hypothetical protein
VLHDPGLGAEPDPAGIRGRQVDVHVNVRGVEHRKDPASRGEDFAHIGNTVLDAPLPRRDESIVEDVDPVEFDVCVAASSACCASATLWFAAFCAATAAFIC